jgi:hypothetical protein
MWHLLTAKVGTNFADKLQLLSHYSSLADSGYGIFFKTIQKYNLKSCIVMNEIWLIGDIDEVQRWRSSIHFWKQQIHFFLLKKTEKYLPPQAWVLIKKSLHAQLLKNFRTFSETWTLIIMFIRALYRFLSWARSIHSTTSHSISLWSILILSTHIHTSP